MEYRYNSEVMQSPRESPNHWTTSSVWNQLKHQLWPSTSVNDFKDREQLWADLLQIYVESLSDSVSLIQIASVLRHKGAPVHTGMRPTVCPPNNHYKTFSMCDFILVPPTLPDLLGVFLVRRCTRIQIQMEPCNQPQGKNAFWSVQHCAAITRKPHTIYHTQPSRAA